MAKIPAFMKSKGAKSASKPYGGVSAMGAMPTNAAPPARGMAKAAPPFGKGGKLPPKMKK